jgi:hypothetical protein
MVLYALNLEVARAPWVTKEAMIAEMRLQWWADAIDEIFDGKEPRKHEVVTPLAELIRDRELDRTSFEALIEARRFDIYPEPHKNTDAFDTYIADTAGGLMWLSAQALGASRDAQGAIQGFGCGVGLAALMRAVPALKNAQKAPLIDEGPEAIRALCDQGLARLAALSVADVARPARAALRSGWMARKILLLARQEPLRVLQGGLELSEFERRAGLMTKAMLNRF